MKNDTRNISIDLIKVIAMFMVMTLHVPIAVRPDYLLSAGGVIAGVAIPLFFMVSGYLLIGKKPSYLYSWKKIFAILKFVLFMAATYFLIESIINKSFSWINLIKAITNPFIQKGMFSVFWYLGAMLIIYLLLPIINTLNFRFEDRGLLIGGLVLFIIESFIFTLNLLFDFEYLHVIQTLRLWNWLFYFILGGIIHKYIEGRFNISILYPLLLTFIYILYGYITIPYVHAVEYLFSSPLCMLYAFIVFLYCCNTSIKSVRLLNCISFLSNLFLPVYAFHMLVIVLIFKAIPPNIFGWLRPIVFLLGTYIVTISFSWVIMKVPIVNRIFKF